jgi:cyclopropane fatty-acyl-phospholipid synthase-like methyltransferase
MDQDQFETIYAAQAPWDIPGPQPDVVRLEEAGEISGAVLDAGCGTGENALYLAARGHEVWGVDYVPVAIERAKVKAASRASTVHFQVANALELEKLGRRFDTVIDCGLFHTFGDHDRAAYVAGLATLLEPGGRFHLLCFSDAEPPGEGPRRVSQAEIVDAFRGGWEVERIRASTFEIVDGPWSDRFSAGGPKAWIATIVRKAD